MLGFTAMKLCYTNISVCANLPFRDTRSRVEVPLMYKPSVLSENIIVQLELS